VADAPLRLLLADDQALVRGALAALLTLEPDLEVVAEVGSGDEVVAACEAHDVDVALLDVEMPGLDGIEATARLKAARPATRVLIVTTFGRPGFLRRALRSGADGFVVKDTPARQLADAVRRVHAGLRVVDPTLAADSLVVGESPLTTRESDVLRQARGGATIAAIAKALFLSEGTVRNHLSSAIQKTGAATRAEAARIAQENGWL
jgi:two-component system, NarL family, response regulator DesR